MHLLSLKNIEAITFWCYKKEILFTHGSVAGINYSYHISSPKWIKMLNELIKKHN